jgi:hypothetical protein
LEKKSNDYVASEYPKSEAELFKSDSYFQNLQQQLASLQQQLAEKEKQQTILLQQQQSGIIKTTKEFLF